jgi:hypothetical protein
MSMDEAGNGGKAPETSEAKKGTRSRPVKVRKHTFQSVNSRLLTAYLDELHREGGTVLAINQSQAVGGNYEVVSYKES